MQLSFNQKIRRWSRTLFGQLFVYTCLFSMNMSFAAESFPSATSQSYDAFTLDTEETDPLTPADNATDSVFSISDSDLGLQGPLSLGLSYGSLEGQYNVNAQYTEQFAKNFALSLLGEVGPDMYRLGGTLGFNILAHGLAKISAERFSQALPFSFESGDVTEDVAQNAYGARYLHAFENNFFTNLNGGIYYADAPNITLDPVEFSVDGMEAINYRHIAGGTSKGLDIGTDLQLTPMTTLSAQLYYDQLRYKTIYEESDEDAEGLGGGLGIKQLLSDRVSISVLGDVREIYDTYTVGISWLPRFAEGVEISLLGQRIESNNETPDSTNIGLQFGFDFGIGGGSARYALAPLDARPDLETWTQTPAVYMDQVLAISDESVELKTKEASSEEMMALSVAAPTVTAISPVSGPLTGGTLVTLTGTGFTGASSVHFGTHATSAFTVVSDTQITVTSPSVTTAGNVNITVITPSGTSPTGPANLFTYQIAPTVTSLSPVVGLPSGGTKVVIKGARFTGASAVNFGSNPGTNLIVNSATQITVTAPAGSVGTVNVTVTTPSGVSPVTATTQFTYQNLATVTAVTPNIGPTTGGTPITIMGSDFINVSAIHFNNTLVGTGNFIVVSPNQITLNTPAGAAGAAHVTVTTPVGTSTTSSADVFNYQAAPTVTRLSPVIGNTAGGSTVTITGTNFNNVSAVKFGTQDAQSYTLNSATSITAVSPSGTGIVDVKVITAGGTNAVGAASKFSYQETPTVSSVTPNVGPEKGGTRVTITGTSFTGATAIKFGNTQITNFTIVSPTTITATTPAGTGASHVTVTTPAGTSVTSSADIFNYQPLPIVSALSPAVGTPSGGTSVTITGSNFSNVTAVQFGTQNATSFTVNSPTSITAVSPAGTGATHVTVTTAGGTSTTGTANLFTYQAAPTITSLTPVIGLPTGGTSITITGTNFTGATAVHFGNNVGTSLVVRSATSITVSAPAGTADTTVDVTVTTPVGTSAVTPTTKYTYENKPTVTGVAPNIGSTLGGTLVTLTGTGFIGASAVKFGTVAATSFTVVSSTQITVTAPAHAAGAVNVTVTTSLGTSVTGSANIFTYQAPPVVSSIAPTMGTYAGGTAVTLTGSNFSNVTAVKFGSQNAQSYTVNSPTSITAFSPPGTDTVHVTVITAGGTSTTSANDQFTYINRPTVTQISPNAGLPAGGTAVTITGTDFATVSAVHFGSAAATFELVNPTTLIALSPPGSGTVHITVTSIGGTSNTTAADQFTYEGIPSITYISPAVGLPSGNTVVTLQGANFTDASAVNFGPNKGTIQSVTADTIVVLTPTNKDGSIVNVSVVTPVGVSTETVLFTYASVPTITDISPDIGPVAGGTDVSIYGTGFYNIDSVNFGNSPATDIAINSNGTRIIATAPAGSAGPVDISVTTPGGQVIASGGYTYQAPPSINSLSTDVGLPAGGTVVTISGNHFNEASKVTLGGVNASITSVTDTEIVISTPSNKDGVIVPVVVTTPIGSSTETVLFTYASVPTITQTSPDLGPLEGGTPVVILGTGFYNIENITFGNNPAVDFEVNTNGTKMIVISPAGEAGTVDITVKTPGGDAIASRAFTYQGTPSISGLSTDVGLPAGGTQVTLYGNFFNEASQVTFGGINAVINSVTDTEIVVTTPSNQDGTIVPVVVTTPIGTSTELVLFTYASIPIISSLSPQLGPQEGGTPVIIQGSGFYNIGQVTFGNNASSEITSNSTGTEIIAISPAGVTGIVDITVTTPGGDVVASQAYTYQDPPSISGVSPDAGLPEGGNSVVITGNNFINVSAVTFGKNIAPSFTINTPEQITVTAPPGLIDTTVDVFVTTPAGISPVNLDEGQYTYENLPTITALSPNAGLPDGGTEVVISGYHFTSATQVLFGTKPATFNVDSPTQITAVSPPGAENETVNVIVKTPVGDSAPSIKSEFTYEFAPVITALSPNKGDVNGGTIVTITGENFIDATSVYFGDKPASSFTVDSATQITAVSPPGEDIGTVSVTVTTPIGHDAKQTEKEFLYTTLVSVVVTPLEAVIHQGSEQQFTATGIWSDGTRQDITQTVAWSSSNTYVATISSDGLASGHYEGNSRISASVLSSQVENGVMLYVKKAPKDDDDTSLETNSSLNSLASAAMKTFTPILYLARLDTPEEMIMSIEEMTLPTDEAFPVHVMGVYDHGVEDLTTIAQWQSSNPDVAVVDDQGIIKTIAPGTTRIRAFFKGASQEMEVSVR